MRNVFVLLLIIICISHAQALEFSSTKHATRIIELYTSEGCSSCPPADKWLSQYKNDPGVFSRIVPMAFHVDYWDYIGWKDPFASAAYSHRQRMLARQGVLSSVYTPAFIVDGNEWRGWFKRNRTLPKKDASQPGILKASINNNSLTASFAATGPLSLNLAYLGMGLVSSITAGENKSRVLKHDFVVLDYWTAGTGVETAGVTEWRLPVRDFPEKGQEQTAIVIWLTRESSHQVVQATGVLLN